MHSPTPQHLQIYNPPESSHPSYLDSFPRFNSLPQEVRDHIWNLALEPHERLLRIDFTWRSSPNGSVVGQGDSETIRQVGVNVHPFQITPKLHNVCQEARLVSSRFYRVEMPCRFLAQGRTEYGTLHLNPETDILKIRCRGLDDFCQFAKEFKAGDPKGIGLLNIAMDLNDVNALASGPEPTGSVNDQILIDTLSRLKSVFFVCLEPTGRMYHGPLNGVRAITGWEMHRSRPIMGALPSFQRLQKDPRSIDQDLKKVFMGTFDPRLMFHMWKRLLQKYEVETLADIQYRFMVSCLPRTHRDFIIDRPSAQAWIDEEDLMWVEGLAEWEQRLGEGRVRYETQEELKQAPQSAIGFWLFPIEAIGEMPSIDLDEREARQYLSPKRVEDLSGSRPELALMDL